MMIIKRKGHTEEFDEKKVYASIYAACISSNYGEEESEQVAKDVTEEVQKFLKNKKEALSFDIREKVIKELRKFDLSLAFCYSKQIPPENV